MTARNSEALQPHTTTIMFSTTISTFVEIVNHSFAMQKNERGDNRNTVLKTPSIGFQPARLSYQSHTMRKRRSEASLA